MFQFRRFPSYTYVFSIWYLGMNPSGLLHSEIHGSMLICSSPWLIAAYHVFHRLLVPRHSPCALCSLTNYACSHDLIVVFVTLAFAIVIYTLIRSFIFRCSIFKVHERTMFVQQIIFSVKITTETLLRKDRLFEASSSFQGICHFSKSDWIGPWKLNNIESFLALLTGLWLYWVMSP